VTSTRLYKPLPPQPPLHLPLDGTALYSAGIELTTLFLWSFLAATILPLGSEPALGVITARGGSIVMPVFIATLGNYLGACTTYLLALKAVEKFSRRERGGADDSSKSGGRAERAARFIQRYGAPALLLSWVPIIGDAIVAAAGAAKMKFFPFTIFTIVGKAARYIVVALAVREFF
jgi:membrane protein YqaA with SNARE-associated domain